ncbi:GMC oxidoreductase [Microcella alkaliphila]|uniref:GMC oxidoreductase n=1 Tax=Microcella alkaliphila TaxID=279828 RepID=UPI001E3E935B|nr:GMC family oxidoreductase [Microcella alkaliphila]
MSTDILIIGSGMGGSTLAWGLREGSERVLVVERGDHLPREAENSDPVEVHVRGRYKNAEDWIDDSTGRRFRPGVYYWVGGNTKVYGACLPRFRRSDFESTPHHDGVSPAWPFSYDEIEPHYSAAETLYHAHGQYGEDPTEPPHSRDYTYPPLEHEPTIERLAADFRRQGLHPFHMATALDVDTAEERAACTGCDGAPCETGAKSDAENRALQPALDTGNVELLTRTVVTRLEVSDDGRTVIAALAERDGEPLRITARKFVVSAGAVNSAALLLRSTSPHHPHGLGNATGLVGRNYMVHNSTFFMAIDPRRTNSTQWQKTLGLNDWYEGGKSARGNRFPLGNVQMLGKLRAPMLKSARRWVPNFVLRWIADHSVDFYLTTEDLPRPENRIVTTDGDVRVRWQTTNMKPHRELVRRMRQAVRRAGYPIVLTQRMGIETNSHQCGTIVAGVEPSTSVLDPNCRLHEVENTWVVDSSFFPSSAALNPALTIAANALRVAERIGST